ncbi:hypothetical protein LUZ60_004293 [Juncus effusus]|nr:hypothetical protein LUZ60_004293 [Juncus effusus]
MAVANMLFLESPVGVGFSYSNSKEDNKLALGDTGATEDAYVFLLNWLERFPEYKNRDFYIIGQSFAGRYIPLLANYIVSKNANSSIKINLKGVAAALEKALPSIDIYNVYAPSCQNKINGALSYGEMTKIDPCLEDYTKAYFDLPEVQTALHANITRTREFEWDKCRKGISMETWNYSSPTMVPVVKELLSSGLRTWIYNGDMDSVCPVAATKKFLNKTGVEQIDGRREFFSDLEIAGFVTSYANVTVVVVRGSGHMVPKDQPQTALLLFSSFLRDKLPPLYPIYPSDAPPAYDPDNSQDLGPSPNDPYEDDSQYSPPAPNAPADDDSEILSPSPSPNDSVGSQIPAPPKHFF